MAIPTGVKVGVILVALAGAGFMFWKSSSSESGGDHDLNSATQWFKCTGGHEFTLTAGEARRAASGNNGMILCPQCQAISSDVFKCPNCQKTVEPVGHGQMPDNCPHCKKSMLVAAPPAGK